MAETQALATQKQLELDWFRRSRVSEVSENEGGGLRGDQRLPRPRYRRDLNISLGAREARRARVLEYLQREEREKEAKEDRTDRRTE